PMDPATLNTSTVTLTKLGTPNQSAAVTVSYDSATKKMTISPTSPLAVGVTYRATIKGGASGAADSNHIPLASDKVWSFTTSAVPNTAPTPTITAPTVGTLWKVGDVISFAGSATDAEDGALPGSALTWDILLHHCVS